MPIARISSASIRARSSWRSVVGVRPVPSWDVVCTFA